MKTLNRFHCKETHIYTRGIKLELKAFLKAYTESFGIYHKESEERELLGERGWILVEGSEISFTHR